MFTRIIGNKLLSGTVHISGSKNACLPILAAALLVDRPCIVHNVPRVSDILVMLKIIEQLGAEVSWIGSNSVKICAYNIISKVPDGLASKIRGSICLMGAIIARNGYVSMPHPGGCNIGERPIDLHIKGLRALGCNIEIAHNGNINVDGKNLHGATINLCGKFGSTVTGTMNVILAALSANGATSIEHAAIEPEVIDFCKCLTSMGADIEGIGTSHVLIHGKNKLHEFEHTVIGDRIEAGTFVCAGIISGKDIAITGLEYGTLDTFLETISIAGGNVSQSSDGEITVKQSEMRGTNITTGQYPALSTDLQPQLCTVLTQAYGDSAIVEKIYPDRFLYVRELKKMGADIRSMNGYVKIHGRTKLHGANLRSTDLRASAALYLAGLYADGVTTIQNIRHLDRGYENFEYKLHELGATVYRINDEGSTINSENVFALPVTIAV